MAWQKISLRCTAEHLEVLSNLLEGAGAISLDISSGSEEEVFEHWRGEAPLWQQVSLSALYPPNYNAEGLIKLLEDTGLAHQCSSTVLADQVWEQVWKQHARACLINDKLWICPTSQPAPDGDLPLLWLDPGLAFGTGSHPTTSLCLHWLAELDLQGVRLIDYGCGSGILALAASLLGAGEVVGVDNDPFALQASADNAERNNLQLSVQQTPPEQSADVLIANILPLTLVELAPTLTELVRPGGRLGLSGIMWGQQERVLDAYSGDFVFEPVRDKDEWVLLCGTRVASA